MCDRVVSDETLLLSTWHAVTFSTFLQTTLPDRWGFHRPSGAFSWHQVKDTTCQGKTLPMMFELSACPQIGCAIPTFAATLAATLNYVVINFAFQNPLCTTPIMSCFCLLARQIWGIWVSQPENH